MNNFISNKNFKIMLSRHLNYPVQSPSFKKKWMLHKTITEIRCPAVHISRLPTVFAKYRPCIQTVNNNNNNLVTYSFKLLSHAFFLRAWQYPCEAAKKSFSSCYEWRYWSWANCRPPLLPHLGIVTVSLTPACQVGRIEILWDLKLYTTWGPFFKERNVKSLI